MRRISGRLMVCVLALTTAGCAGLAVRSGTAEITEDYVTAGGMGSWGDEVIVLAKAYDRGGRTAVCGAWMVSAESVAGDEFNPRVMGAGIVKVGGHRVAENLRFMARLPYTEDATGETANCTVTSLDWQPGYESATEVILPRQWFGGGQMEDTKYRFRQTPVQNVLPE